MRKFMIITLLLSSIGMGWAQDGIKKQAKDDLLILSNQFVLMQKEFKTQDSIFKSLIIKLNTSTSKSDFVKLEEQKEITRLRRQKLDAIYTLAQNYIVFYKSKFTEIKDQEEVLQYFKYTHQTIDAVNNEKEEMKTLLYFGKDKVIAENDGIFKDKTANLIFNDILEAKSEAYLGDFIIPQIGQKIISTRNISPLKKDNIRRDSINYKIWNLAWVPKKYELQDQDEIFYFKNIKIHIVEGSLFDIQLFVTDEKNNELLFENKTPISLLKATKLFPLNTLYFKTVTSNNKDIPLDIDDYKNYGIILSDALVYTPNPGDNYVPEDLRLEFPTKTDGVPDNINNSIKYKVNQNTSLQNIVELRTYTDFLGLFGDAPNGILQLEGKADFFIRYNRLSRTV